MSVDTCSAMVGRGGKERPCKRTALWFRNDQWWCKNHAPAYPIQQWTEERYRRIGKQGGSRILALGTAVPADWTTVKMSHCQTQDGRVEIVLEKVN